MTETSRVYAQNLTTTLSNGTTNAYMTVSKSAQNVYPVASQMVSEATGLSALSEDPSGNPQSLLPTDPTCSSAPREAKSASEAQESEQAAPEEVVIARENLDEEHERGPSHPDRAERAQKQIGTETGIPTTAGAGTTVSADDDVQPALKKEKAQQAAVGVDYADQPCPTADARRGAPSSQPAQGKTQFDSKEEQLKGSSQTSSDPSSHATNSTPATSAQSSDEQGAHEAKRTALTSKLKGQAKVVAGKLTRNEDKVEQGKKLKSGGVASA